MRRRIGTALVLVITGALVCSLSAFAAQETGSSDKTQEKAAAPNSPDVSARVADGMSKDAGKKSENGTALNSGSASTPLRDNLGTSSYRIGIEDDLQISVWKEPDLSISVIVRPDGMITMPLLNDIYVNGLQTAELQALLTEKLKPFVNEPQVTIVVRGIKSRKAYVYGQVVRAGAYSLVARKTVLEVLAEAGGLNPFAKRRGIYIMRTVNGQKTQIPFNYTNALKGKNFQDNPELQPGDIVVVP